MATRKRTTRRTASEATPSPAEVAIEQDLMSDIYAQPGDMPNDTIDDASPYVSEQMSGDEQFDMGFWVARAQSTAKDLAELITREVQAHPVRTLAIAGAAGFLLASSTRARILPALVKSGVGIAAAVALRQAAELGLENLGLGTADIQRDAAE